METSLPPLFHRQKEYEEIISQVSITTRTIINIIVGYFMNTLLNLNVGGALWSSHNFPAHR